MSTGVIQSELISDFRSFASRQPVGFSWQLLQVQIKTLEGYEAGPRVASTDIAIDDSGGKTGINDKALKIPFVFLPSQFADTTITHFRVRTCTQSREQFESGLGARGPPPVSGEVLGCSYRHFDGSQSCDSPIPL